MKKFSINFLIWLLIVLLMGGGGLVESLFSRQERIDYDYDMETEDYQVDIQVGEDNTYLVRETISVDFQRARHGIFRYLPRKDVSPYLDEEGKLHKEPFHAKIQVLSASEEASVYEEDGNTVIRLGNENRYEWERKTYEISYRVTPRLQRGDYSNAYYNIFPQLWQNDIPAGSRFSIAFPKEFDREKLKFYTGDYGSTQRAEELLELSWEGKRLNGTVKEKLPWGYGLTFFARMDPGYFEGVHTVKPIGWMLLLVSVGILALGAGMFLFFGRDEPLYPSIQFQPPQELDSAAVGYVIDGRAHDRDLLSLIIYWADRGYLHIVQKKGDNMVLMKKRDLPEDAKGYERTIFYALFKKDREKVSVKSLEQKFASTLAAAKNQLTDRFSAKGGTRIYSRSSMIARGIALLLCPVPFGLFVLTNLYLSPAGGGRILLSVLTVAGLFIGTLVFCHAVDNWYSKSRDSRKAWVYFGLGLGLASLAAYTGSYVMRVLKGEAFLFLPALLAVLASSGAMVALTGFMKKRSSQCVEWMGRLAGLRDFIETAELERLQAMAKENPQWFYHILPYAYVFGLSDVFAEKLEALALPAPEWYEPRAGRGMDAWDYYMFHRMFMGNLNYAAYAMAAPPKVQASGSHFDGDFGSFGGGGFSGGGGGFSGGGFGGGGGGSW